MARLNIQQQRFSQAQPFVDEALQIQQGLENRYGIATCLRQLGTMAIMTGDIEAAQTHFERSLAIRDTIRGDKRGKAKELLNLATVYLYKGKLGNALFYYNEGFELAKSINSRSDMVYGLDNMGTLQVEMGDYAAAGISYDAAISLADELGDMTSHATAQTGKGLVHILTGQLDAALPLLQASREQLHQLKDTWGMINNLMAWGSAAFMQARYSRATRLFRQVYQLAHNAQDLLGQVNALYWQGRVLAQQGNPQALAIYQQAIAENSELGDDPLQVSILARQAALNLQMGQIFAVPDDLTNAIALADAAEAYPRLLEALAIGLRYIQMLDRADTHQLATWYAVIKAHGAYSTLYVETLAGIPDIEAPTDLTLATVMDAIVALIDM